ncbi:putative hydrolase of the HAD superfamily [Anoxybacillus tepidamans]|uniref:Putative hydrolase of the HAD superfamily n=1 Tax=Anoxybacteroides tepidamans TaxID=265948 RepID=A0A7W8ISW3_9BACL|nr:HAD family hydrolase [Anoxybacillus tepidamans]MBB5326027.1 putative hydrolase of the HAD superfamily [Anoxybacillus tepidamans]
MLQDIKIILFDLDNTLFPFEFYWERATKETFYRFSLTKHLPFDEFFTYYQHYDHYFWKLHHEGHISLDEVRQQRLIYALKHFDQHISMEEADIYFREFFSYLIHLLKPDEEVNVFLRELKKTYKIGIITNGKASEQRSKLEKLCLYEVFTEEEIFISEETGFEKPQLEAFHLPLLQYGMEHAQAVFVGDSWNNDVVGAINAGMSAIWINPKCNKQPSEHKPLFVTENIMTLKDRWVSLQNAECRSLE